MSLQEFKENPKSFFKRAIKFTILEWVNGKLVPHIHVGRIVEADDTAITINSAGNTHYYHTTSLKFRDIAVL